MPLIAPTRFRTRCAALAGFGALLVVAGCRRDMQDQPKYKPLQASRFFVDGRASRPLPGGAIAIDELNEVDSVHTGAVHGQFLAQIPIPVNKALLERGQERYNIFCSPCHGYLGDGNGMIARRGFKWPANLQSDRLRAAPPGYVFQVISNGYGAMMDYSAQIHVNDRWAIVAYLHALQLSQRATLNDVPQPRRSELEGRR